MNLKEKTINKIIEVEGGYINDESDSGGETNFGITVAVARDWGYMGPMRDMPREVAYEIYVQRYWDSLKLDDVALISDKVAHELADTGVNMGTSRAGIFFQEALNCFNNQGDYYPDLVVDGAVGGRTIAAFKAFMDHRGSNGEKVMYRALNALQGAFYIDLTQRRQKDEKFVFGWFLNRVE